MKKYLFKRFIMSLISIWAIITITFFLMHVIPGNPFDQEGKMPPGVYENLQRKYGLDKPKSEQYTIYLKNLLRGDLGDSMKSKVENVNDMIKRAFPVSAYIAIEALLFALILGPALGVMAALYQNKFPDHLSMFFAIIGTSVPSFIMATILIQFVAKPIAWLPIGGWGSFKHTLLPALSLSLMPLAYTARLMRSSMLEVLQEDYIKTAESKGIRKSAIILKHALRNSAIPLLSILGTIISNLLVGSFVVEKIFGIPGLGSFFVKSIVNRDYTLIMGTTIFYSIILITILFLIDIAYVIIDPRIRLTKGER